MYTKKIRSFMVIGKDANIEEVIAEIRATEKDIINDEITVTEKTEDGHTTIKLEWFKYKTFKYIF